MTIKDLTNPIFSEWVLEIYNSKNESIMSNYERDTQTDKEWIEFLSECGDSKVVAVSPAAVKGFLEIHTNL